MPGAAVTIGAASRDQARIAFERMRGFAQHPAIDGVLTIRRLELRHEEVGAYCASSRLTARACTA